MKLDHRNQMTSEMLEDAGEFKVLWAGNVIAADYQKGGRYIGEDNFRELSVMKSPQVIYLEP